MRRFAFYLSFCFVLILVGCSASRHGYKPGHVFTREQVTKDYTLFQSILSEKHPSLYWYTPKESMDEYFKWGHEQLRDSMTEYEFKKILSYVAAKINCGHTSVRSSNRYERYADTVRRKIFPLSVKIWDDKLVVTSNLILNDSLLKRGTVIQKINGLDQKYIVDSLFRFISSDGFNVTNKYQALSNRGLFGNMFAGVFGQADNYEFEYLDSLNQAKTTTIPAFDIKEDSVQKGKKPQRIAKTKRIRKKNMLKFDRDLRIDSTGQIARMDLNSFTRGLHLKKFFRYSFKTIEDKNIPNLVIDVRSNGGGSVGNSTFFTKYISDHPFKIADSLYAISRKSNYGKHIENNFTNRFFLFFTTRKKADGKYHFGYYERHFFQPKKNNHFDGKVYIITGGNSFSATALFVQALIQQKNVVVVGEETGGGSYGNSAWLIPDVTLPNTKLKFSLPLFRLVIDKNNPKTGRGIFPEIESKPTVEAIKNNIDFKYQKVLELIRADKKN